MEIYNNRNQEKIEDVEVRDSFIGKMAGLMFQNSGRALLKFWGELYPGIWMPFMRFSLDLAFIDSKGRIREIMEDIPPMGLNPETWGVYRPKEKCKYVLEVESGLLKEKGFKEGDVLEFEE